MSNMFAFHGLERMKAMGKTARGSPPRAGATCGGHPAILPWRLSLPLVLAGAFWRRLRAAAIGRARSFARGIASAADAELVDQRLITGLVLRLQIIEQAATLRDHLEQAPPRMVVLDVRLEVLGEVGDAFGKDRDLHLGRTGVALLDGIFVDERLLALGSNRHRTFLCLRASRQPGRDVVQPGRRSITLDAICAGNMPLRGAI